MSKKFNNKFLEILNVYNIHYYFGLIFFSILHFWILQSGHEYNDVMLFITVIGWVGLIAWLRESIQFDESGFWVFNIFGPKKRLTLNKFWQFYSNFTIFPS